MTWGLFSIHRLLWLQRRRRWSSLYCCWITCWVCAGLGLQSPPKVRQILLGFWIAPFPLFIPKTSLWYYSHLWIGFYPDIYIQLGKVKEEHFTNTNQYWSVAISNFSALANLCWLEIFGMMKTLWSSPLKLRLSQSTIICKLLFQTSIKGWREDEDQSTIFCTLLPGEWFVRFFDYFYQFDKFKSHDEIQDV